MRPASGAVFYAHTALVQVITFTLRPTATYRAVELEVPTHLLGALAASFAVVPLVLAVPAGRLADRYGERTVMLIGSVAAVLSALAFVVVGGTVSGLAGATVLLGLGHLFSVVGQQALVANHTVSDRYDTAFGHYTFATSLGQALGPGLIVLLGGEGAVPRTGAIFASAVALTVVLVALSGSIRAGRVALPPETDVGGSLRELVRKQGLLRALAVSSVVLAAVDITLVYLPALGAERGIAAGTVGFLLTLRAVTSMASRLFLGRLVGWLGRRPLLLCSLALSAVALGLMVVPMPSWLLAVVVAFAGLGLGACQPLTMSWLAETTPPGLRGTAMSLRLTGNRFGQVVVPTVAGILAVGTGAGGVMGVTALGVAAVGFAARRLRY